MSYLSDLYLSVPTVSYCEKITGGLIERPYYAVGNAVFVIAGIIILLSGKGDKLARAFGWIAILVGLLSFVYDATYSHLFQVFDFAGMFIFATMLFFLNFKRINLQISQIYRWLIIIIGLAAFLILGGQSAHVIFAALVLAVIISEFFAKQKESRGTWYLAIALFLIGTIFWYLDLNKIVCDPSNIFNGRNIYHLLDAAVIYYLYKYYSKITI